MKKPLLFTAVLLTVASLSSARADSITGAVGSSTANIDLNDFSAFAYYGNPSVALYSASNGAPSTDGSNLAKFTDLTAIGGTGIHTSGVSPRTVSYSGGTSPNPSESNAGDFYYNQGSGVGIGFSLTTTLFASTETFQFLLQDYDTSSTLTASLNDASSTTLTLSNQILPDPWAGGVSTGTGNTYGLLTLTVQGEVGQTLTFKDLEASTALGSNGNVGIEAVTVEEIPEPSTWAMMGLGILLFAWLLCRGRKGAEISA